MRRSILAILPFIAVTANALVHEPAVSRTHVAFIHGGQVWVAPRGGGPARQVTDTAGRKFTPRFSPDGSVVAFAGNESRNMVNIYTVPVAGGTPSRVTYLPSHQNLTQWTRDDRLLFYTNSQSFSRIEMQLFTVPSRGGLPQKMPPLYGAEGAIDDSGEWLAYTPKWPNPLIRYWKRYRGGAAADIHLVNLRTGESTRVTDWKGVDTSPMWHGPALYYLSDAGPDGRLNLWSYDTRTKARRQWTHYRELDVRAPSMGAGAIAFVHGADAHLLDLKSGAVRKVTISLPASPLTGDADANRFITNRQLAGRDVLFEARGDLWLVPAGGAPRNLTSTSGVFEREASLSPDGESVAYFADATGEYQLYVHDVDRPRGEPLTGFPNGFRYRPVWSRDSARLAFSDHAGDLFIVEVRERRIDRIDGDPWGETPELAWSADSRSLAYTRTGANRLSAIWQYDVDSGARRLLTSDRFYSGTPAFSPDGEHVFFISYRHFGSAVVDWQSQRIAHRNTGVIMAVPLRSAADGDFERAAFRLPTTSGTITSLAVSSNGDPVFGLTDGAGVSTVRSYDMEKKSERVIVEGSGDFTPSSDGRHILLVRDGNHLLRTLDDTAETVVDTTMPVRVDLRAEWRQIFQDAWRFYRDFFYAPKAPLVEWDAVRARYAPLIDHCVLREEVNLVLAEMIGESSVGHAYIAGDGDVSRPPANATGMLGADYALQNGAFRIVRIFEGAATDDGARSPIRGVKEGQYLLAVNDTPMDTSRDPRAAFTGLAGREVTITVGPNPVIDGASRKLVVTPVASETDLRYRAWVERNRQYVDRATAGRFGYIHVPVFNTTGYGELVRQFTGQIAKEALIIDARWSEGGSTGGITADLLDRTHLNSAAGRYSGENAWPVPRRGAHFGRKALIVNHITISAGENFSLYFRKLELGPIVGARTWGGLTGLNPVPSLIDGGAVNVPNAPFFDETGWIIEGVGLVPDVLIERDPATGGEPELDAAIAAARTASSPPIAIHRRER